MFKANQIVRDRLGNHFRVVSTRGKVTRCESVASKEIFDVDTDELTLTNLKPR